MDNFFVKILMTSSTRNFLLGKGLADLRPDNEFIFLLHSGLLLKFFELRIRCALTWSKWKISSNFVIGSR